MSRPPFLESLADQLLDGFDRRRRRRRRAAMAAAVAAVVGVGLVGAVASRSDQRADVVAEDPISTTVPASTTSAATAETPVPCQATTSDDEQIHALLESFPSLYNDRAIAELAASIGDGPVRDASLDPMSEGSYRSIAEWIATAERMDDQLRIVGYGVGEPLELFASRSNPMLGESGITEVSFVIELWVRQDCEVRVSTRDAASSPDPCRLSDVFGTDTGPGCGDAFDPRYEHAAVWTGTELLVYGGGSGTFDDPDLDTGFALNPATGESRPIAPSPGSMNSWPRPRSIWTGDRMLVVGRSSETGTAIVVQTYDPASDTWNISAPLSVERAPGGAAVWTGDELLLVGGVGNWPDDDGWAYSPQTDTWRQLPDPPLEPTEGLEGVWIGDEAVFIGGYAGAGPSPAIAYDPSTDTWRELAPIPDGQWFQGHELIWTGGEIAVISGHGGPSHAPAWRLYDPATDGWRQSAPLPIPAGEWLGADWTGTELIIWGGFGSYGSRDEDGDAVYGEGAAYDPTTDQWRVLAPAAISDRCHHSGTWTDSLFVVFGGLERCGDPGVLARGDGAVYDPVTDEWRRLASSGG